MSFFTKAMSKYGTKFSYEKTKYINNKTKIIVTCPMHGDFFITPNNFLSIKNNYGCIKCGNIAKGARNKKNTTTFIAEASKLHQNKYMYDKANYVDSHTKITITCPIHGDFEQKPHSHLQSHGCDKCAREANSISTRKAIAQNCPITLYYIYIPELNIWKIGCTKNIQKRFTANSLPYSYEIIETTIFTDSREAYFIEGWILRHTIANKTTSYPEIKGNTEFRTKAIDDFTDLITTAQKEYTYE